VVDTGFWWGDLSEGDHLKDPGVDGRKILKMDLPGVRCGSRVCTDLIQDKERWRAVVNAVTKFLVP